MKGSLVFGILIVVLPAHGENKTKIDQHLEMLLYF
jgi:hypothetical protein